MKVFGELNAKKMTVAALSAVFAVGTLFSPLSALVATTALAEDESTNTTVIHHPAEYETVHHDAEYTTVHHDVEYRYVHTWLGETVSPGATTEVHTVFYYDDTDIAGWSQAEVDAYGEQLVLAGHNGSYGTIQVEVSPAHNEQVLVRDAYDEQRLVRDAWDEIITDDGTDDQSTSEDNDAEETSTSGTTYGKTGIDGLGVTAGIASLLTLAGGASAYGVKHRLDE